MMEVILVSIVLFIASFVLGYYFFLVERLNSAIAQASPYLKLLRKLLLFFPPESLRSRETTMFTQ